MPKFDARWIFDIGYSIFVPEPLLIPPSKYTSILSCALMDFSASITSNSTSIPDLKIK